MLLPWVRYIAIGLDQDGDDVFNDLRLPNCYLHLAWARRSYLDKRSPVSVRYGTCLLDIITIMMEHRMNAGYMVWLCHACVGRRDVGARHYDGVGDVGHASDWPCRPKGSHIDHQVWYL
jgi:hypothetical protein